MSKKSVLSSKKSCSKPKKSYPPEVREKAVKLITELGYSVADVAQQLGCSTAAVRRWKEAATPLDQALDYQTPNEVEAKYFDDQFALTAMSK